MKPNANRRTTNRINFTVKELEKLQAPANGRVTYYDAQTNGLGILIQPKRKGKPTRKTFFWFRRVHGAGKWKKIGAFSDSASIDKARGQAALWNSSVEFNEAPFEQDRGALTFGEVLEDYIARHLTVNAKNPTRAEKVARWQVKRYIASWKERKLASITPDDIEALRDDIVKRGAAKGPRREKGEPGQTSANRLLGLIRTLFNWAINAQGWKGTNPTRKKFFPKSKRRKRYVQRDEMSPLFKALRTEENLDLRDFVYLALFTGARRGDIVAMRWEQLSRTVDNKWQWLIPNPKNEESYVVPLMPEAVAILKNRRQLVTGEWVFPSSSKSGHVGDFKKAWKRLLVRAQITNLRVHDLRRTLGSWQAGAGVSLHIIGRTLGHESEEATQVYSEVDVSSIRGAINVATRAMLVAAKMNGRKLLEAPRG